MTDSKPVSMEDLRKALDEMKFWWQSCKLTVCDPEGNHPLPLTVPRETWLVETLSPDNFNAFYEAFDKFSCLFPVFQKDYDKQRKQLSEVAIRLLVCRAGGRLNMFEAGELYQTCLLLGMQDSRPGKMFEQEEYWQNLVLSCRTEKEAEQKLKMLLEAGLERPPPEKETEKK